MLAIDCPCGHRLERSDDQIRGRIEAEAYEVEHAS
jgi:hypothetical protein